MSAADKYLEADDLEARAEQLRKEAYAERREEGRRRPLAERLIYSATARCMCGAGLAYDPFSEGSPESPFMGPDAWDCSAILLGTAIPKGQPGAVQHDDQFPFSFYEIKSEGQPSAHGATTRPKPEAVDG